MLFACSETSLPATEQTPPEPDALALLGTRYEVEPFSYLSLPGVSVYRVRGDGRDQLVGIEGTPANERLLEGAALVEAFAAVDVDPENYARIITYTLLSADAYVGLHGNDLVHGPRYDDAGFLFSARVDGEWSVYRWHPETRALESESLEEANRRAWAEQATGDYACAPVEYCGCWRCARMEALPGPGTPHPHPGRANYRTLFRNGGGYSYATCDEDEGELRCHIVVRACTASCPPEAPSFRCEASGTACVSLPK